MEAKSPFKFLDAYTANDTDIFVGREVEEKKLFQQLRNTTLNLLYGMSGTGKTSLAQCGLAKFYDGADWHPFYIRRGNNINKSLLKALKDTLIDVEDSIILDAYTLPELVYQVFITFSRPVYLIFDQFEELFTITSDNKEERDSFFKTIQELQKQNLPCKIIIIIREEFLGQLYEYERFVPNLFDFRLRVEPMTVTNLQKVTTRTLESFKVKVSQDNLIDTITQNLLDGKISSQLAFLQVYLDRLWQEAEHDNQQVTISDATVSKVGKIEAVLEKFLDNQLESIADKNDEKKKQLRLLLDRFVTEDGTKRPIAEDKLTAFEKMLVKQLESVRIIRKNEIYYELAHDTLAVIINNKRDAEQQLIKSLVQNLQTSYFFYKKGYGGLLGEENIALYDQFKNIVDDITNGQDDTLIQQFIEDSRNENIREEKRKEKGVIKTIIQNLQLSYLYYKEEEGSLLSEPNVALYDRFKNAIDDALSHSKEKTALLLYIENSRKENAKEKEELEKTKKRLRNLLTGVIVLGLFILGLFIFAYNQFNKAEAQRVKAQNNLDKYNQAHAIQLLIDAQTFLESNDTVLAKGKIREAYTLDTNSVLKSKLKWLLDNK